MDDPVEAPSGPLVLLTGAAGKIGKVVLRDLIQRGFRVRAITSRQAPAAAPHEGVEWRVRNFMTSLDFDREVEGCTAVIHLAAEITDMSRMQRVNVDATKALAEASERADVQVFCYVSSASVYGSGLSRLITEDSPTLTGEKDVKAEYIAPDALRAYGRTKLLGEIAIRGVARSTRYIILRPTVVVDTDDVLKLGAISGLRRSLLARRHAHYVYIEDVSQAIVWLMERELMAQDREANRLSVYNVAEDDFEESSYKSVYRKLYALTGDRKYLVPPTPEIVDRLVSSARLRIPPGRLMFGQMFFSADKLKREGFEPRSGLAAFYEKVLPPILSGNAPAPPL